MNKQIQIKWKDLNLSAIIHFPACYLEGKNKRYPLIIICHGFIGSKVGVNRLFVKAAEELSKLDAIVLRFDYSGCGESEGNYGENHFDDLVSQTIQVIDFALTIEEVDPNHLILIGHSLGGAVAMITAARDDRVKKLVLWSAVANPFKDILSIVGVNKYEKLQGRMELDYLGYPLKKEFFLSMANHHPLKNVGNFTGDVLVVHGTEDEEIPVEYCFHYFYALRSRPIGRCKKQVIMGANHTYSSIKGYRELMDTTLEWLIKANQ
ncbi:alpha/beta hydrolase family protein [Peribacillus alkalitolerans]|uniref:alpha/beta hydrolase family protein n=1 Tax=Peribacillus alkalitolerans TaxID=1550385 RepID=UPI0013D4C851|nr:alpha/beta fold hydrolase [Peribacillus alkalitolerans]